jgi:hypothetical protein
MIRPPNAKAKTILKVAISLAVVAFVLFIWAGARPVPIQVRVTFTGFTNLGLATFCVSNAGRCSVFQEPVHRVEINNKHDGLIDIGWMGELKPGEFNTISLFPPREIKREPNMRMDNRGNLVNALQTNLEPWRLSLSFYKAQWRDKLVQNPPRVLREAVQFVPAKWLVRYAIEVHSDWIDGRELMPVATNTANTPPK